MTIFRAIWSSQEQDPADKSKSHSLGKAIDSEEQEEERLLMAMRVGTDICGTLVIHFSMS